MMTPEFHLHSKQGEVFRSKSRYKVLCAGRRFGKTYLAVTSLVIEALSHSECKLWYLAPFRTQAKEIAWEMLKSMSPKETVAKKNESELFIEYVNGSRISIKGADNEESLVGVYLGSKNHPGGLGIVIDEVAIIRDNKKVWENIVQPMLSDCQAGVMFIGTPRGKDFFWELWRKGQRKEDGFESWHFTSYDNKWIPAEEIDAKKKTMSEIMFNQEHLASFVDYVGAVYPEFNHEDHVIDPFPIPENWEKIAAIDVAMSGTSAVLFAAIDTRGVVYFYDEYYEKDKRVSEVSGAIKDRGKIDLFLIDPASQAKTIQKFGNLYSLYDEFSDNGIHALPAENDVEYGINRVAEYLKDKRIKIFKTCKNLIWEIERYHWAESKETVNGVVKPKPYKKDDHLNDTMRYIIAGRPKKAAVKAVKQYGKNTVAWEMEQEEIEANDWRKKYGR